MAFKAAPLHGSFMLTAILGFLISVIWVYPKNRSYGFAFGLIFVLMFIASIISMTYGPAGTELKMDKKK
ncbi:MAG: hypothetical protein KAU20_05135 [Nanoarchaeota archaeon]|nr:hypothetical protein [Nanoarchaeota archaeon]